MLTIGTAILPKLGRISRSGLAEEEHDPDRKTPGEVAHMILTAAPAAYDPPDTEIGVSQYATKHVPAMHEP